MRNYSWYTTPVKLGQCTVYKYAVDRYIPNIVNRSGFGTYIHVKAGTFVTAHDGGWERCKLNRKGGYNRKDSHLLNVEGKNLFGKRWTKLKKYYNPKVTLFNGVPKRFWLKLELTKIYYSMMSFVESQVINEISQMMLNRKKQDEKKQN